MAPAQSANLSECTLFLLDTYGQGMLGHVSVTAMNRVFEARRGQALAITDLSHLP